MVCSVAAGDAVEISLRDKIATQSSTASNAKASRATDGNTDTTFSKNSCTATKQEESPWWSVDLDRTMEVKSVTVFNRGDCCGDRLNGFEVKVGDDSKWAKNAACGGNQTATVPQGESVSVDCGAKRGRFVSVVVPRKTTLHLCEVRIMVLPKKGALQHMPRTCTIAA